MGFFKKETCLICGAEVGMMGKRKIKDGVICKDCKEQLSPYFHSRKSSTLEEIQDQLRLREENKKRVEEFIVTRQIGTAGKQLFIDLTHRWFAVGTYLNREENPDVFDIADLQGTHLEKEEYIDEEITYYEYNLEITTRVYYAPSISLALSADPIQADDYRKVQETEDLAHYIIQTLNEARGIRCSCHEASPTPAYSMERQDLFTPGKTMSGAGDVGQRSMVCAGCGRALSSQDRFCPDCGRKNF